MGSLLGDQVISRAVTSGWPGINPDYSYGRNNWEALQANPGAYTASRRSLSPNNGRRSGPMDLTSHIAALKAAKPDLIFSSMLSPICLSS